MTSLADLIKNKKAALSAGNRKKTAKIPDGTSRWRILPSWRKDGSEQFWHDFGQHFIKNSAGEMQAVYVCVDKTFGKPCVICDTVRAAVKSAADDATLNALKDAHAAGRILINAMHLDGPTPTEVQIAEIPPTVFDQILGIVQEWMDAGENPMDVKAGKDFLITRVGSGKNTKYSVQVGAKVTKVDAAAVMAKLNDLDAYVAMESSEQEQRALNSVRSVAGLIAAPTRAAGIAPSRLAAPESAMTIVEDPYEVATPPRRAAAAATKPVEFEDVPDVFVPPAAVAAAPVEDEGTGDPELDALLRKLG